MTSGKPKKWSYDLAGPAADYPAWRGAPQSTVLICTQQRSGSTLLSEALHFAGGLGCPLEYFHSGFRPDMAARWQASDIQSYAAALHRHRTDPSGVLSVKLFWTDVAALVQELAPGQFDEPLKASPDQVSDQAYQDIQALLAPILPRPRVVRLIREDSVAQAVSTSVAMQRRRWRRIDASDPAHGRPVEFRFAGIAAALSRIQAHEIHWRRYCAANAIEPYVLTYEALARDYDKEVGRLLRALGRGDARVTPPRVQKQADALSDQLAQRFRSEFHALVRGRGAPR